MNPWEKSVLRIALSGGLLALGTQCGWANDATVIALRGSTVLPVALFALATGMHRSSWRSITTAFAAAVVAVGILGLITKVLATALPPLPVTVLSLASALCAFTSLASVARLLKLASFPSQLLLALFFNALASFVHRMEMPEAVQDDDIYPFTVGAIGFVALLALLGWWRPRIDARLRTGLARTRSRRPRHAETTH